MALRGKFQRPQNRPATIEYTEKGLSKLCCKTQRNLESPLFQAFFSTYVPEKAFSVCIKDSVFIDPCCGSGCRQGVPSRFEPVDKSKNSAETHSGSSRTVNLEIAKDGIYHPLEV